MEVIMGLRRIGDIDLAPPTTGIRQEPQRLTHVRDVSILGGHGTTRCALMEGGGRNWATHLSPATESIPCSPVPSNMGTNIGF